AKASACRNASSAPLLRSTATSTGPASGLGFMISPVSAPRLEPRLPVFEGVGECRLDSASTESLRSEWLLLDRAGNFYETSVSVGRENKAKALLASRVVMEEKRWIDCQRRRRNSFRCY